MAVQYDSETGRVPSPVTGNSSRHGYASQPVEKFLDRRKWSRRRCNGLQAGQGAPASRTRICRFCGRLAKRFRNNFSTVMGELLSKGYQIKAAVPNGGKFVVFMQKDQSAYACEMQSLTASRCGTLN